MFEDALMESGGRIKTKSKYFTIVGFVLNGSILAAMILVPLIYPEALPKAAMATLLVAPPPPPPPPPPASTGACSRKGCLGNAEQPADCADEDS